MRIYELIGTDFVCNKIFPMGSTILVRENGDTIVCVTFARMRKTEPIPVCLYVRETGCWKSGVMKNAFTEELWAFHIHQITENRKGKTFRGNYAGMMKHDRKKKCGSGGVRIGKFCGQVTDYECRKDPLHDFRRVWN